jgi:hypothetical protein
MPGLDKELTTKLNQVLEKYPKDRYLLIKADVRNIAMMEPAAMQIVERYGLSYSIYKYKSQDSSPKEKATA